MTAAQGRPCLQGLEWCGICGPEAGSGPTVPWQENAQPSQPRQLGYSQEAVEMEGCSTMLELGRTCRRRGRSDESGRRYFILFLYHKDTTFAIFRRENPGWWWGGMLASGDAWSTLAGFLNHFCTALKDVSIHLQCCDFFFGNENFLKARPALCWPHRPEDFYPAMT